MAGTLRRTACLIWMVLVLALVGAACSSGGDPGGGDSVPATTTAAPATTAAPTTTTAVPATTTAVPATTTTTTVPTGPPGTTVECSDADGYRYCVAAATLIGVNCDRRDERGRTPGWPTGSERTTSSTSCSHASTTSAGKAP